MRPSNDGRISRAPPRMGGDADEVLRVQAGTHHQRQFLIIYVEAAPVLDFGARFDVKVGNALQPMLRKYAEFRAREHRSHAEVLTDAERRVRSALSVKIHRQRIREA